MQNAYPAIFSEEEENPRDNVQHEGGRCNTPKLHKIPRGLLCLFSQKGYLKMLFNLIRNMNCYWKEKKCMWKLPKL